MYGVVTQTNGVWDTTTVNWTSDNGVSNEAWVNGSDAVFGNSVSNAAVTIDIEDSGVTVGDLTLDPGGGKVSFMAITDDTGAIPVNPGGATWARN